MSIFDTLRYPISHPPTAAELDRLPLDLFAKWVSLCGWHSGGTEPAFIAMLYSGNTQDNQVNDVTDFDLLKRMILDYEHI